VGEEKEGYASLSLLRFWDGGQERVVDGEFKCKTCGRMFYEAESHRLGRAGRGS